MIDLRDLPRLQDELKGLQDRAQDRERNVSILKPELERLEQSLAAKKKALRHLQDEIARGQMSTGTVVPIQSLTKTIEGLEDEITHLKARLKVNVDVAEATRKLIEDWPSRDTLTELRRAQALIDSARV